MKVPFLTYLPLCDIYGHATIMEAHEATILEANKDTLFISAYVIIHKIYEMWIKMWQKILEIVILS